MSAWVPANDKRVPKALAKVTDAANTSKPELKSHQRAQDTVISAEGTQASTSNNTSTTTCLSTTSTKRKQSTTIEDVDNEESPNGEVCIKYWFSFANFLGQRRIPKGLALCNQMMK